MPVLAPHLEQLASTLAAAARSATPAAIEPGMYPRSAFEAYRVQREILRLDGRGLGGIKVGSKSATGPIHGALLPNSGLKPSAENVQLRDFPVVALELEIAFRFGKPFLPRPTPYTEQEVLDSVAMMAATIEIVSSRLAGWPDSDALCQLADLQNHGALIVGEFVPYDPRFPFEQPPLTFTFAGQDIGGSAPVNPAGDPRRLLSWAVNHCLDQGLAVGPDLVITTGSYTGAYFLDRPGLAAGEIAGLPPVQVQLV
ncbi:2-keto-4-pentenoate hydratase [Burkholderia sp. L27(2015)]|jgi:2-keto-4-pentenoate hydratase|uniref:2-keto-4-pentenoate hydratase n=1 Tax=Burkholderia sp. L27(2015) TaxID=1641858 RepID=UPI00131DA331|nr:2-keto-4-pentenoate hydratase [Burkholderia sp. L27(2015)]